MGLVTYGLNFIVRGAANSQAAISNFTQVISRADRAIQNHARSINRNLAQTANASPATQKLGLMWNGLSSAVGKVGTAFSVVGAALKTVLSVATGGFVVWVGTGLLLKKVADTAIGTARAMFDLGKAAISAAETVSSKVLMIQGRLGPTMGKIVKNAALDASRSTGIALDEIIGTTNIFLNNPELRKMIEKRLKDGDGSVVKDLAVMMKQIQVTNPDIAARIGIMLPNILGGSAQSFKFGFEVSPEQAETAIKNYFGGKLPAGVSAAGFRSGEGMKPFQFVQSYLDTLMPRDTVSKMAYMASAQVGVLGGSGRALISKAMGAEEENLGVVGAVGKSLGAVSDVILNILKSEGMDKIAERVAETAGRWGEIASQMITNVLNPLTEAANGQKTWGEAFSDVRDKLLGISEILGVIAAGFFETINNLLGQDLVKSLKSVFDLAVSFFGLGLRVMTDFAKVVARIATLLMLDPKRDELESAGIASPEVLPLMERAVRVTMRGGTARAGENENEMEDRVGVFRKALEIAKFGNRSEFNAADRAERAVVNAAVQSGFKQKGVKATLDHLLKSGIVTQQDINYAMGAVVNARASEGEMQRRVGRGTIRQMLPDFSAFQINDDTAGPLLRSVEDARAIAVKYGVLKTGDPEQQEAPVGPQRSGWNPSNPFKKKDMEDAVATGVTRANRTVAAQTTQNPATSMGRSAIAGLF